MPSLKPQDELELLFLYEMERVEAARNSLIDFTLYTKPDYETNWHHNVIAHKIDMWVRGDIDRLMVFAPPQHGKSELVSRRLPAYLLGRDPDLPLLATSYGARLARRMNRDVQRIIQSPEYNLVFPDTRLEKMARNDGPASMRAMAASQNNEIFEIVGHTGFYLGAGIGQGIAGFPAKRGIIDDPIKSKKESSSEVFRETTWEWYENDFLTRLARGAPQLLTLTRWHEDDLAGRILKLEPNKWEVVTLRAMREEENLIYDPRKVGEALWPFRRTLEDLEDYKLRHPYSFAGLYQQRPAELVGDIIKVKCFKTYQEAPRDFEYLIQTWDMAVKDKEENDWVVGQVWGKRGPDAYLLHQYRAKAGLLKSVAAVLNMRKMYPQALDIHIEDKANGSPAIEVLKRDVPGIIPYDPKGVKKTERAVAINYMIEGGNVYIPDPRVKSWVYDFIEECAIFPNVKNDDQVDAMTLALLVIGKPSDVSRLEAFLKGY